MKPENVVSLVKELEKIKGIRSRNSYRGAWFGLILSIIGLTKLYMIALEKIVEQNGELLYGFIFMVVFIICLQSLFIIVRHLADRKFGTIIEILLENKSE